MTKARVCRVARVSKMAEKSEVKNRKRKHFEMEKSRQSPFQNANTSGEVPRGINAAEFAESRALEIHTMMHALSSASAQSNKRVFQSVPRHMRRRAASHNSKRMPVRLRDAYNREALKIQEKQKEPKQKKSRRYRRKPSNLREEYNRRQRNHVWLETHIWHAKRFKMVEQWGYKIPLHPNDKSVRASYRAMGSGCLLQDISYYQCTEVHGKQDVIVAAMKHLTSSDIGLTIAANEYLNGTYEGQTILYKYDQYPYHAIGPVMFLWQQHLGRSPENQQEDNTSVMKKLWLWCHPGCSDEVLKEIVNACSLEGTTRYLDSKPWLSKDTSQVTENKDSSTQSNSQTSENGSELTVTVLREQLVRLRLTGPKSHALLKSTFELCDWNTQKDKMGSRWWEVYNEAEHKKKMLQEQNGYWDRIRGVASPGVLKAGSVIALVVKDPRVGLPVRKSSIDMAAEGLDQGVNIEGSTLASLPSNSAVSPLWDYEVRRQVKQNKMPEKDLNNLRAKQAVPGCKLDLGHDTSRVPLLVIQQPGTTGNQRTGSISFGSGYDVIIPAGWSMAFWIALVYRGARVGGIRELETCSREQGVPHFPRDFPDTKAGREYNEEQKGTGKEKYERYPPAKRPNYLKFGVASPFGPDWNTLVNEWSGEAQNPKVDTKKALSSENREEGAVKDYLSGRQKCLEKRNDNGGVHNDTLTDNTVQCKDCDSNDSNDPMAMAVSTDIEAWNKDQNKTYKDVDKDIIVLNGTEKDTALQEGVVIDHEEIDMDNRTPTVQFNVIRTLSTRRCLQDIVSNLQQATKKKHQKDKLCNEDVMKFLKKSVASNSHALICLNLRSLLKGSPHENAEIYIPTSQDLKQLESDKNYGGPVEDIHKCNTTLSATMIGLCSRKAIGWVTSGQYSFARGQGSAVGFCTFLGFYELLIGSLEGKYRPLVLVRNTNTVQYRFASITVV